MCPDATNGWPLPMLPPKQATLDGRAYQQRFLLLYASILGLLAAPVAAQTFDPGVQVPCWRFVMLVSHRSRSP